LAIAATCASFVGINCLDEAVKELKKSPATKDRRLALTNIFVGGALMTMPAATPPLSILSGRAGNLFKTIGTTTRIGIATYGAYTMARTNISLWRHYRDT
jgi:hypothetical protein